MKYQFNSRFVINILIFLFFSKVYSQNNWTKVGQQFNRPIRILCSDSINGLLYAGGDFSLCGSDTMRGISVWDEIKWDSLGHGQYISNPVRGIGHYQNKIYANGIFSHNWNNYFASWNGTIWDTLSLNINGPAGFTELSNELYVFGKFDSLNFQPCASLAKYNGSNWYCFPFNIYPGANTGLAVAMYHGDLYFGGSFQINNVIDLIRWDGANEHKVGQGILGSFTEVNALAVYKNELYIAGYFSTASGNPSNNIMKWDGVTLSSVGAGVDGAIFDMAVYKNELYVVGVFDYAGGIQSSRIAKWNGTNWSALGSEIINNTITTLCFHRDELYIGGGFNLIDNDTIPYIAKYTSPLSVDEYTISSKIKIVPNPAKNNIKIFFTGFNNKNLIISNIYGNVICNLKNYKNSTFDLDISNYSSGLYFVNVISNDGYSTNKFIKE